MSFTPARSAAGLALLTALLARLRRIHGVATARGAPSTSEDHCVVHPAA